MLRLAPPIWALIFAIVAAAVSWTLGWPGTTWLRILPLGVALFVLGWIMPVWAITLFRRAGTEVDPTSATNRVLVIRGPYRITRNPMYLGLTIVTLGLALMVGSWPMLAVPVAVLAVTNWGHIPFEEAKMRRQFGGEYDAYTSRVGRWL